MDDLLDPTYMRGFRHGHREGWWTRQRELEHHAGVAVLPRPTDEDPAVEGWRRALESR